MCLWKDSMRLGRSEVGKLDISMSNILFSCGGHLYKWKLTRYKWHTKRVSLDLPRLHKQLMPHKNKLAFPWLEQTQTQAWQELSKSQLAGLKITARFSIHCPTKWLYCRKERDLPVFLYSIKKNKFWKSLYSSFNSWC